MQCVILVGGMATRMRPITESIPKAMISIGQKPFIDYQLAWLSKHGVHKIVLSTGYKGQMIRDFVQDGKKWGLQVAYVDEGKDLRGTGGALRLALDLGALDPSFFVLYGDSYLPVDFSEIWSCYEQSGLPALMTVFKNSNQWEKSNACVSDGRVSLYDKTLVQKPPGMHYVDYGLSALRRDLVAEGVPSDTPFDIATLLNDLSVKGQLAAYEVASRFYEIGSPAGLEDFTRFILRS